MLPPVITSIHTIKFLHTQIHRVWGYAVVHSIPLYDNAPGGTGIGRYVPLGSARLKCHRAWTRMRMTSNWPGSVTLELTFDSGEELELICTQIAKRVAAYKLFFQLGSCWAKEQFWPHASSPVMYIQVASRSQSWSCWVDTKPKTLTPESLPLDI